MKTAFFDLVQTSEPKYRNIAESVRRAILKGTLRGGEKLPSLREIAIWFQTTKLTALSAMEELIAEGWIFSEIRKGYRVCLPLPESTQVPRSSKMHPKQSFQWKGLKLNLLPFSPPSKIHVNFQPDLSDFSHFPIHEFRSHLADTLRHRGAPQLLSYGSPAGYPPLIEEIRNYLRRVRQIQNRKVIITHGSQEALYLIIRVLLQTGDKVAIESLCYPPLRELLKTAGIISIPISVGEQGMDPKALQKVAEKHKLKFLFLSPLHQFPTTRTIPMPIRLEIYEICVKYGIAIVEDDYDYEFHYRCHPLPPMASQDDTERILYILTFSKTLFPSARIGFLVVPSSMEESFLQYRRLTTHHNEQFIQAALFRWMESGKMERHIRRMQRLYESRWELFNQSLQNFNKNGKLQWQMPAGGMAYWVNFNQDTQTLCKRALEKGIFLIPETNYQLIPQRGTHVRMGFCHLNESKMIQGLEQLAEF